VAEQEGLRSISLILLQSHGRTAYETTSLKLSNRSRGLCTEINKDRQKRHLTLTNSGCTSVAEASLSAGKPNRLRALLLAQPLAGRNSPAERANPRLSFHVVGTSRGIPADAAAVSLSCVFPRSLHVSPLGKFGCGVSKCDLRQGKEPTGIDVSARNSDTCWITSADGHAASPSSHDIDGLLHQ
jgi:hypothetical protein